MNQEKGWSKRQELWESRALDPIMPLSSFGALGKLLGIPGPQFVLFKMRERERAVANCEGSLGGVHECVKEYVQSGQARVWCTASTKCVLTAASVSIGHSWKLKAVLVLVVSWFLPTPWSQFLYL